VTASGLVVVGTATIPGTVTIIFSNDPTFILSRVSVAKPTISITSARVVLSGHTLMAPVALRCAVAACSGGIEMTESVTTTHEVKVGSGSKGVTKKIVSLKIYVLATTSYRLALGQQKTFDLKLSARGRSVLQTVKASPRRESVNASVTGGTTTTKSLRVS
jgi:hypothetical protein